EVHRQRGSEDHNFFIRTHSFIPFGRPVWSGQTRYILLYSSRFQGVKEFLVRPMIGFISRVDKIAADIQKQIAQGKLHPGDRLPSERNLCVALGVGRTTIREALKSLGVRGVVARKGRATVISDPQNILPAGLDL